MVPFLRRCVVWLTLGAFACASTGDGALHLLLNLSAVQADGRLSSPFDEAAHVCCAHHARPAAGRDRPPSSSERALSADEETTGHDAGACPICQFTALAKSVQTLWAPVLALDPIGQAHSAAPVVLLKRCSNAHLPRGPPSLSLSEC